MADLKKLAQGRKAFASTAKDGAKGGVTTTLPARPAKRGVQNAPTFSVGKTEIGVDSESTPQKPAKSLEQSSAEEIGEVETAFRGRMAKEDKRREVATDSEFWFAVYFKTREEKDAFLRRYGLDKVGDKYLSGSTVDRVLQSRVAAKDSHIRNR